MPLLSPPPPPARRGGSSRRLSRIRRRRSRRRDWAALPLDALLHVFHKLDHVDLMFGGASRACRSWRSAAREPELWRRIDFRGHSFLFRQTISLKRMAWLAIWFSAGQCMAFMGEDYYVDDNLIRFLGNQAPLLKSLRLTESYVTNSEAFGDAIKKWPLLEELEFCECYGRDVARTIEFVVTACPQLKHFKYGKGMGCIPDNSEALAIARLHELRSLQLLGGNLDYKGLTIILDNCPRLEFLDVSGCYNVNIDSSLHARVRTKKIYPYAYNDFTKCFEPSSRCYSSYHHDERDCDFLYAEGYFYTKGYDYGSSEDSDHSFCFSRPEEIDFEEHERSFDKGTRRRRRRYLRI